MTDNYRDDLAVLVGGRNHYVKVEDLVRKAELNGEDPGEVVTHTELDSLQNTIAWEVGLQSEGMSGNMKFVVDPSESTAEIADQNENEAQVMTATVVGVVGATGGGDLKVTVTARGMTNSPKEVTVTVTDDDDASAIAGEIRTALAEDADVSDSGSAFFTVSGATDKVILTANTEAPADDDMEISLDVNDVDSAEGEDIGMTYVIDPYGSAYTRYVDIYLQTEEEDTHSWFSGDVALSISDNAAGDAHLLESTVKASGGTAQAVVYLTGTWEAANTNTLEVDQTTIMGYTVSAVTSVETSEDST